MNQRLSRFNKSLTTISRIYIDGSTLQHSGPDKLSKSINCQTIYVEVADGVQENEGIRYPIAVGMEEDLALSLEDGFSNVVQGHWQDRYAVNCRCQHRSCDPLPL